LMNHRTDRDLWLRRGVKSQRVDFYRPQCRLLWLAPNAAGFCPREMRPCFGFWPTLGSGARRPGYRFSTDGGKGFRDFTLDYQSGNVEPARVRDPRCCQTAAGYALGASRLHVKPGASGHKTLSAAVYASAGTTRSSRDVRSLVAFLIGRLG
jgi:hypothetical protein